MRVILILLCLVICFLFGVLYGVDKEKATDTNQQVVPMEEDIVKEAVITEEPVEEVFLMRSNDTPAFKAASTLETVVDFFYDVVVEVLYQVSKLFY